MSGYCSECGTYMNKIGSGNGSGVCNICTQSQLIQEQTLEIRHNNQQQQQQQRQQQDYLIQQQLDIDMKHNARLQEEAELARKAQESAASAQQQIASAQQQIAHAKLQEVKLLSEKEMSNEEAYNRGFNFNFSKPLNKVFEIDTLNERGEAHQQPVENPFLIERLNIAFNEGVQARMWDLLKGLNGRTTDPGLPFMLKEARNCGFFAFIRTNSFQICYPTSLTDVVLRTKTMNNPIHGIGFHSFDMDGYLCVYAEKLSPFESEALNKEYRLGVKEYVNQFNSESHNDKRLKLQKEKLEKLEIEKRKIKKKNSLITLTYLAILIITASPTLLFWYFYPDLLLNHWLIASSIGVILACILYIMLRITFFPGDLFLRFNKYSPNCDDSNYINNDCYYVKNVTDNNSSCIDLYGEAVIFVTESRKASISSIQRRFKIGYNQAATMIETMEAAGIVSSAESNGSRVVLAPPLHIDNN